MSQYLQGIATVLSLINPAICVALFASIEGSRPAGARVADATKAAVVILVILSAAALVGSAVLRVFGVSIEAFQVAGGLVLVWMGFSMLKGAGPGANPAKGDATPESPSITPLVLFAASPGTITGVITLAVTHSGHKLPVTALVAVGVAVTFTWIVLVVTSRASGKEHKASLMHDVTSRFMGLVVLAMGVQFALAGTRTFFAAG